VIVFAVACSTKTNNTYMGPYAPWPEKNRDIDPVPKHIQSYDYAMDRLSRLFVASLTLKGMTLLAENGANVSFKMPQAKLSAYEAGIGVYGRSGIIIHPVLGNRLSIGIIPTDAVLEPDGRLEGFEPCNGCDLCAQMCPAKAFDGTKTYPQSYSRAVCEAKRAQIADKGLFCHNCFAVCPAGQFNDEALLHIEEAKSILKRDRSK
jgi:ferredoxin